MSPLQEDEERYYVLGVIAKSADRLRLAVIEWPKEPFDSWRARTANEAATILEGTKSNYSLPVISGTAGECSDDSWTPTINLPAARDHHTALWTGNEMIVFGGIFNDGVPNYLNTGERYNPTTDSWMPINSTNAPPSEVAILLSGPAAK